MRMTTRRQWGLASVLAAALAVGPLVAAGKVSGQAPQPQAKGNEAPGDAKEIITFEVRLPAGAVLEIDGNKTTATGESRKFETPPLRVGGHYSYTLKATANGKVVTRTIDLAHRANNTFDLRAQFRPADTSRSELVRLTQSGPENSLPKPGPAKGKRAQEFIAAFEKGDAKAVAEFWTENGDYTDENGREYKGRPAIQKMYEKFFADNKGLKLNIIIASARMIGNDVALQEGVTEVTPAGGGLPSSSHFSAVLVKKDGEWYFESVRDSLPHPPSNAEHFDDLDWLIGEWTGEAEKGESSKASYAWAENRNFIVSHFATTVDGVPVVGGTQWIAWDAVDRQIRSYSFYSGGGVGEAVWSHNGNQWTLKVTAKMSAGKKASATNIVTKTDNDHMTWQVTNLTVDGQTIPDPKPVKLKRVKPVQP
jgi:uncharacterized protein (TIGR02246 family)